MTFIQPVILNGEGLRDFQEKTGVRAELMQGSEVDTVVLFHLAHDESAFDGAEAFDVA